MASEQLMELIKGYLNAQKEPGARERLAGNARVSMSTVQNALKGRKVSPSAMYRLAVACGLDFDDARALAGLASAEAIKTA